MAARSGMGCVKITATLRCAGETTKSQEPALRLPEAAECIVMI